MPRLITNGPFWPRRATSKRAAMPSLPGGWRDDSGNCPTLPRIVIGQSAAAGCIARKEDVVGLERAQRPPPRSYILRRRTRSRAARATLECVFSLNSLARLDIGFPVSLSTGRFSCATPMTCRQGRQFFNAGALVKPGRRRASDDFAFHFLGADDERSAKRHEATYRPFNMYMNGTRHDAWPLDKTMPSASFRLCRCFISLARKRIEMQPAMPLRL